MGKKVTILLVDDNEVNLKVLERPLLKEGFEVVLCDKSKESIDILSKNKIDIVLLDWVMPEMSGLEVCRIIKADKQLKYIPVIIVTARSQSEDLRECLEAGANDYIRKPVDKMELIARVRSGLRTGSLQRNLNRANTKLIKLNNMKDEFLAMASHDLRSPVSSMVTVADLLLRHSNQELDSQNKELVEGIKKTGQNVINMIEDFLDLSKIEEEGFTLKCESTDLGIFFKEALERFEIIAKNKNIALGYQKNDALPCVEIDAPKMAQVINNLISNAIKFTDIGGNITLRSHVNENGLVEVKVEDTGRGIEEQEIPFLFEKYSRISKPGTKGEKGTGLGLVIAKKIVALHGGKIWAESKVDVGTTFAFTMPVVSEKEKVEQPCAIN